MKRFLPVMLALGVSAIPFAASAQGYDPYYRGDSRYGYDNGGQQVRCESKNHQTRTCRIDTRGGVRIVRQESDAPCVQGRTWGYDRGGIWVTRGCRARFEVGGGYASNNGYGNGRDNWRYDDNYNDRYGYGSNSRYDNNAYGNGYAGGNAQTFRCESINGQPRFCRLPYQARGVEIRRQLSDTRCSQGYNWGWQRDGVWVEQGCRAEFVAY